MKMRFDFSTLNDFLSSKIVEQEKLKERLTSLRAIEKKDPTGRTTSVATINGSFDLLHAGHLYILYEASQVADILIVALNTDASIKRYKSPLRPIIPLKSRLEMMAALSFVDFVTWFDEDDPRELILKLRPDIHVNGKEYGEHCIEADTVHDIGARLHLVDRIPGLATSDLIKNIGALLGAAAIPT